MTDHPVIGISSYQQQATWGNWDDQAVLLPRRYVDKVAQAGGLPVLLPPSEGGAGVLARLDALVLSGGSDVDPARYGAAAHPGAGPFYADRDSAELDLCRHALASGLPVLGICRGLQVLNVALGGTLHQHLPDLVGNDSHSPERGGYGAHKVSVAAGTSWRPYSAGRRPRYRRTTTRPSTASAPAWSRPPGPTTGSSRPSSSTTLPQMVRRS